MASIPFPDRLKKKRKEAGETLKSLAEKAGVSDAIIGFYENRQRPPQRETIEKLADALGLSESEKSEWLLSAGFLPPADDAGELTRIPVEVERHVSNYSKLKPVSRRLIDQMAAELLKIERGEMGINEDEPTAGGGKHDDGNGSDL